MSTSFPGFFLSTIKNKDVCAAEMLVHSTHNPRLSHSLSVCRFLGQDISVQTDRIELFIALTAIANRCWHCTNAELPSPASAAQFLVHMKCDHSKSPSFHCRASDNQSQNVVRVTCIR